MQDKEDYEQPPAFLAGQIAALRDIVLNLVAMLPPEQAKVMAKTIRWEAESAERHAAERQIDPARDNRDGYGSILKNLDITVQHQAARLEDDEPLILLRDGPVSDTSRWATAPDAT